MTTPHKRQGCPPQYKCPKGIEGRVRKLLNKLNRFTAWNEGREAKRTRDVK